MFKSITRLYTDFYMGEHKEDYVMDKCKDVLRCHNGSLDNIFTDEDFLEGILEGGSAPKIGFKTNVKTHYPIDIKNLSSEFVKWLKKFHKGKNNIVREMRIVQDRDLSLGIDVVCCMSIPSTICENIIFDNSQEIIKTRICALYNVYMSVKHKMFKTLKSKLSITPGVNVEDICDVFLVEHCIEEESGELKRKVRNISNDSQRSHKILWSTKL